MLPVPSAAVSTLTVVAAAVTFPCTSKSDAVEIALSKMYQVPAVLVPPQLTMRKVTVLPPATFCKAAIDASEIGPSDAPALDVEE